MNKRELNISNNKLYENTPEDIILKSPFKIPPKGLQDLIDIKGVNATEYAYYDIAKTEQQAISWNTDLKFEIFNIFTFLDDDLNMKIGDANV